MSHSLGLQGEGGAHKTLGLRPIRNFDNLPRRMFRNDILQDLGSIQGCACPHNHAYYEQIESTYIGVFQNVFLHSYVFLPCNTSLVLLADGH